MVEAEVDVATVTETDGVGVVTAGVGLTSHSVILFFWVGNFLEVEVALGFFLIGGQSGVVKVDTWD